MCGTVFPGTLGTGKDHGESHLVRVTTSKAFIKREKICGIVFPVHSVIRDGSNEIVCLTTNSQRFITGINPAQLITYKLFMKSKPRTLLSGILR